MAVPHKDWELPKHRYWPRSRFSHLDRHLDRLHLRWEVYKQKCKNVVLFLLKNNKWKNQKVDRKKGNKNDQTSADLRSVHSHEIKTPAKWFAR